MSVIGERRRSTQTAEQRLHELGISLPVAPKPLGAYVEAVQVGSLLFLSGALPLEGGAVKFTGRIGLEVTLQQARDATRLATLNALALALGHLGSLDRVSRVVRLHTTLAASTEFRDHPVVADAASELIGQIFGPEKTSVRMVTGVSSLPLGASCVVELILEINARGRGQK